MPQNVDNFSLPGLLDLSKPPVRPVSPTAEEDSPFRPHAPDGALVFLYGLMAYEGELLVYEDE